MAKLPGGMRFAVGRRVRLGEPPEAIAADRLMLPLTGTPCVQPGSRVASGDALETPALGRTASVSPCAGRISSVEAIPAVAVPEPDAAAGEAPPSGGSAAQRVTIRPDEPEAIPPVLDQPPPLNQPLLAWVDALARTGPWPQPGLPVSLCAQLRRAVKEPPRRVVGVGLDRFPPFPDRSSLLLSFPDDVALGLRLMARLTGAATAELLAASSARLRRRLRRPCRAFDVRLRCEIEHYPAADPTLVAYHATGRKLRHGGDPMDVGLLLVDPWPAIRLARWVTRGRLDLAEPVFTAEGGGMFDGRGGHGTMRQAYALQGQPLGSIDPRLSDAVRGQGRTLILGDLMTGRPAPAAWAQDEPGFDPRWRVLCVLQRGRPTRREPEPCIRCGWCAEVCPTRLRPIDLVQWIERGADPAQASASLQWCIGCGLCSHACPSAIPLAQRLRRAARASGAWSTDHTGGQAP